MSYVKRLAIQGIRAFDPDKPTVIVFERPLTIILGENGCGKTTIIECLKYITTGQVPPNTSRGRDFVHDPSILGRADVKAQIRLTFGTTSHEMRTAIRSLELRGPRGRVKTTKLHSLDGVLVRMERDASGAVKQRDVVMKVSAMDEVMPQLLGVPRAILEHVIFCHQEESTWPLQEGSQVKKHFDDIFATTRYSKAMEEVKVQRKELNSKVGDLKATVAKLSAHSEEARRLRMEIAAAEANVASIDQQRDAAKQRVNACEDRLARLRRVVEQEGEARLTEANLQSRVSHGEEAVARLREQLIQDYKSDPDDKELMASVDADFEKRAATVLQEARDKEATLLKQRSDLRNSERVITDRVTGHKEARATAQERVRELARATVEHQRRVESIASEESLELPHFPQGSADKVESDVAGFLHRTSSSSSSGGEADSATILQWAEAYVAAQAAGDAASSSFMKLVQNKESEAQEAVNAVMDRNSDVIAAVQNAADAARAELASAQARMAHLAARQSDARNQLHKARAALASMGLDATASVERDLELHEQRAKHLAAGVERQEKDMRAGGSGKDEVIVLEASVRRLRRWRRATEERAEALRGVAAKEAEARAVSQEAERTRRALEERLLALQEEMEACEVHGSESDAVSAAEACRVALNRSQTALAESKALVETLKSDRNRRRAAHSQLVGQSGALTAAQESLTARLRRGDRTGETAWDQDGNQPVSLDTLQIRLDGARQALAGELSRSEKLDVVTTVMEQLKSMLNRKKHCPVCGKGYNRKHADEKETMEAAIAKAITTLHDVYSHAAGRSTSAPQKQSSSSSSSAAAASSATTGGRFVDSVTADAEAEQLVTEAQQLCDVAGQWHEGAGKIQTLQGSMEISQSELNKAEAELSVAEKDRDEAAANADRCASLSASLTALVAEWRTMLATERRASGLQAELAVSLHASSSCASSSASSSVERPGVSLGSGDATEDDDQDARIVLKAGVAGSAEDIEAIEAAKQAVDMTAVSSALSRLSMRLQLQEEDKDARQIQLAAKETALNEQRQKLSRERQTIGDLTARRTAIAAKAADVQRASDTMAGCEEELLELDAAQTSRASLSRSADDKLQETRTRQTKEVNKAQLILDRVRKARQDLKQSEKQLLRARTGAPATKLQECQASIASAEAELSELHQRLKSLGPKLDKAHKDADSQDRLVAEARMLVDFKAEQTKVQHTKSQHQEAKKQLKRLRTAVANGNISALLDADEPVSGEEEQEEEYWDDADLEPAAPMTGEAAIVATQSRQMQGKKRGRQRSARAASAACTASDDDDDDGEEEEEDKDEEEADAVAMPKPSRKKKQRFHRPDEIESVQQRAMRLDTRLQRLREMVAESNGREGTLREQIEQRQARLSSKELRNVQLALAHTTIELRTTALAVKDLDIFYRGLDRALMRYHELQIEQANETIRDLWSLTYQGRDIESIQIRSDASDVAVGAAAGKRRSYNYRVVMTKGSAELDMRGRCSAGQKVLACLIIRLALRKAFAATSCGVLALDEPTTSLDEVNKKALAHSLASIITLSKDSQRHFQLIVITHDLDFIGELNAALQTLGAGDGRPKYVNEVRREEHSTARGKFVSVIRRNPWESMAGLHA